MNNHKSSETRKLAIEYYLKNKVSQSEVSRIFLVGEKTFIAPNFPENPDYILPLISILMTPLFVTLSSKF